MSGDGREEGGKETTYTEDSLWVRHCGCHFLSLILGGGTISAPPGALWPSCPISHSSNRETPSWWVWEKNCAHITSLSLWAIPPCSKFSGAGHKYLTFSRNYLPLWRGKVPGSRVHIVWLHLLVKADSTTEETWPHCVSQSLCRHWR